MADREPNTSKGSRWGRYSRMASFWVFLFLLPVLILNLMGNRERGVEDLTYSQFRPELDGSNVVKATVVTGERVQEVRGDLRTPITLPSPTGEPRQVNRFVTRLTGDSDALIEQM